MTVKQERKDDHTVFIGAKPFMNYIKIGLHRLTHIIQKDFELSEDVKKELEKARKEDLDTYVDHKEIKKEFS